MLIQKAFRTRVVDMIFAHFGGDPVDRETCASQQGCSINPSLCLRALSSEKSAKERGWGCRVHAQERPSTRRHLQRDILAFQALMMHSLLDLPPSSRVIAKTMQRPQRDEGRNMEHYSSYASDGEDMTEAVSVKRNRQHPPLFSDLCKHYDGVRVVR